MQISPKVRSSELSSPNFCGQRGRGAAAARRAAQHPVDGLPRRHSSLPSHFCSSTVPCRCNATQQAWQVHPTTCLNNPHPATQLAWMVPRMTMEVASFSTPSPNTTLYSSGKLSWLMTCSAATLSVAARMEPRARQSCSRRVRVVRRPGDATVEARAPTAASYSSSVLQRHPHAITTRRHAPPAQRSSC